MTHIVQSHSMECLSLLFITNHLSYLWDILYSLSNSCFDFYSYEEVSYNDNRKKNRASTQYTHNTN